MFGKSKLKAEIERLKIENESLKDDLFIQQIRSKNTSDKLMRCIKKNTKLEETISHYEKILSDCYVRDSKGRFMRYRKEYKVTEKDLIGYLEDFPIEIVQKMVEYQAEQGNEADVTIFQKDSTSGRDRKGFYWNDTKEGSSFWCHVIFDMNFDTFFKKYPKK